MVGKMTDEERATLADFAAEARAFDAEESLDSQPPHDAHLYRPLDDMPEYRAPRARKGEPNKRIIRAIASEDGETVHYLHATKGWRKRRATPHFFQSMLTLR